MKDGIFLFFVLMDNHGDYFLHTSITKNKERKVWWDQKLAIDDEIIVEIVETENFSEPGEAPLPTPIGPNGNEILGLILKTPEGTTLQVAGGGIIIENRKEQPALSFTSLDKDNPAISYTYLRTNLTPDKKYSIQLREIDPTNLSRPVSITNFLDKA